jgi:hypothetical protein
MMMAGVFGPTDPEYSSVVSLQNWAGADGSTTFTDAKGKVWTGFGNAQIDTEFGQALLLDGSGDYATTPDSADFNLGSNLFTEEGYFRESVRGAIRQIIGQHDTTGGTGPANSSFLLLSDNGKLTFQVFIGSSFYTAANPSQHALDTIHHYAAVRDAGNVFRLYLNGVQVATVTQAGALNNSGQALTIGAVMNGSSPNSGNYFFNGRIFSRRMNNGACRYPGGTTFTPPAYPFPTS